MNKFHYKSKDEAIEILQDKIKSLEAQLKAWQMSSDELFNQRNMYRDWAAVLSSTAKALADVVAYQEKLTPQQTVAVYNMDEVLNRYKEQCVSKPVDNKNTKPKNEVSTKK